MIIADECLNGNFIKDLRTHGFTVEWIKELNSGMLDEEVIFFAKEKGKILITEDKDFGEWVFAHKITGLTIILIRYQKIDYQNILNYLISELPGLTESEFDEFIVINKNKIRRRKM